MITIKITRSKEMPAPVAAPASMQALVAMIAADADIPEKRRADMCSGVRSLCRALGLQIESTPADPRLVAERLARITPATAGMTRGRLQNCRCHMDAAFAHADARFRRRRNRAALAPQYAALLDRTPDRWVAARLRRLFHYATQQGIAPKAIDDQVFDAFTDQLQRSTIHQARRLARKIRQDWNDMVGSVRHWPGKPVRVPTYVDHYVLPAEAFPNSLWVDAGKYLESRRSKGAANLDDLLTEEELFGDGVIDAGRHVRDSTAALILYRVRQFASALVLQKVMPASEMVALKTLVDPRTVNDGLKFFIQRTGGRRENSQIRGIASDMLTIAKRWVGSPAPDLAKLGNMVKKVRPKHEGLPESARRSLAPFRDLDKVRAFLGLPDEIVKAAESEKEIDRAPNRVAAALWIRITQRAPLRISNLLETDLDKNVLRSHNGKDAAVALYYTSDQVKNNKAIEVPLPRPTAKLLDLYLKKYRKLLIDAPCPWLFPAANGGSKRPAVMSADVQRLMREHIGFAINPHSFRHVAAKLFLTAHPGRYVDVQRLLGHRKLETTVKYYTEIEAEEAFKHFDAVLLGLEEAPADKGGKK